MINKYIFFILTISVILSAKDIRCQKDATYYENNFIDAKNPESFNLAWARCEKSLGDDDMAISAYERVLLYNPKNIEAMFALVPLYKKVGMSKDGKTILLDIDKEELTISQKKKLSSLKEKPLKIVIKLSGNIEYGYDTNLNYNVFTENDILSIASLLESSFYALDIKGSVSYNFESNSKYFIDNNIEVYKKDNKEGSYFDLSYAKLGMGIGYSGETFSAYIPIVYTRANYLNKDLYQQLGLSPKLTIKLDSKLLLDIGVSYITQDYINSEDKNANYNMLSTSMGLYHFFADSFIYSKFDYGINEADSSTHPLFTEYEFINIFAGLNYKIKNYDMDWGINYQYAHRDYNDNLVKSTDKRLDEFQQVNLYLKKEITSNWSVKINYSYLNNSSNYALVDYDKQLSSIGLEYTY